MKTSKPVLLKVWFTTVSLPAELLSCSKYKH